MDNCIFDYTGTNGLTLASDAKPLSDKAMPLTRAQKAAAKKAEKLRLEYEALRQRLEEESRRLQAEEEVRREEDRRFWLEGKAALLDLGMRAPVRSGRTTFMHAGCVAILMALIAHGFRTRDEIMQVMRHDYRYSYRHAGFLLSQLCGPDPERHLWYRDADRRYHLHEAEGRVEPAKAA